MACPALIFCLRRKCDLIESSPFSLKFTRRINARGDKCDKKGLSKIFCFTSKGQEVTGSQSQIQILVVVVVVVVMVVDEEIAMVEVESS